MTCTCLRITCDTCFPPGTDFVTFLTYREDVLNARDPGRKERLREAARSQASYLRFLRSCKGDEEANCWHYDPLRRMTPEERESL